MLKEYFMRPFLVLLLMVPVLFSADVAYAVSDGEGNEIFPDSNVGIGTTMPLSLFEVGSRQFNVTATGNVGIGTSVPAARLDVVGGAVRVLSDPATAAIDHGGVSGTLYIQGDFEVDGKIYGDGSALTGVNAGTNWDAIGDPSASGAIAFGATVQTMDWAAATTQAGLTLSGNALTSGSILTVSSASIGLTGDLASIIASGNNAAVTGSVLKVGLTGASAAGTALNVTSAGASGYALRVNDDGTYADSSAFVVDHAGNVGVGTVAPASTLEISPSGTFAAPQGAAPAVSRAGQIAVDLTDDQLVYYGGAKRVLPYERTVCVTVENLGAADDDFGFMSMPDNVTLARGWCHCQGTCTTEATITLETVQTGTAGPTVDPVGGTITCSDLVTGAGSTTFTPDNTVDALDLVRFNVTNTPVPTTDKYTLCVAYTFDAQ